MATRNRVFNDVNENLYIRAEEQRSRGAEEQRSRGAEEQKKYV
jgi:hypothetical protein